MARRVLLRLGISLDLSAVFVPVVPIGEKEQGIESLEAVKAGRMESDGQVSVLKRQGGEARPRREKSPAA